MARSAATASTRPGRLRAGERRQLRGRLGERRLTARADRDAAAFLDQRAGAGEAQSLARAGDDGDLAGRVRGPIAERYRPPRPVRSFSVQSNGE